ncbi:MAG: glycosyltransferase [Candidatus Micrarchaeota archaeon]
MRRPKVLHVIESLCEGGCQRMFLSTLDGLGRRRRMEHLGLVIHDRLDMLRAQPCSARLALLRLPSPRSIPEAALLKLRGAPALLRFIVRENPDVVYLYYSSGADNLLLPLMCRALGKKVVTRKCIPAGRLPWLNEAMVEASHALSDTVVSLFPGGAARAGAGKTVCIPNGKSPSSFSSRLGKARARARLRIPGDALVFGMLTRLHPVKNIEAGINAFARIGRAHAGSMLVIAGAESTQKGYAAHLRKLAEGLGVGPEVVFLGHRDDVADVLPAFDVFLHPASDDVLPGSVLEAMCSGLPVIATDAGGTGHLLGEEGILVPQGDLQALSSAMLSLAGSPALRLRMGKALRKRAEKEFSKKKMLDSYEKLFLGLLERE